METLDNEVDTRGQGAGIHPIAVVYHEDGPELTFVSWGKDKMVASYRARVVSQGSYRAPPANVWYLGAWERSALSGGDTVIIGEVANSNARSVLLWLWIVSALVILIFTTVLVKRRRSSI